jgi:hypothetical protein
MLDYDTKKQRLQTRIRKHIKKITGDIYALDHPRLDFAINKHITSKGKRLEFINHAYLVPLYADDAEEMTVKKPTQVGLTEFVIVRVFDAAGDGRTTFVVLPKQKLRDAYVKTRIDPLLEIDGCYRDMKRWNSEGNLMLKTLKKKADAIFVGSNSRTEMVSYPADQLIVDELDFCDMDKLPLAENRLDHSNDKSKLYVSTPTISDFGIDRRFKRSDMKKWFVQCPACNEYQTLNFFGNVLSKDKTKTGDWLPINGGLDIHCIKCNKPLDRHMQGEYVPAKESDISGYHIPALCHPQKTILEIYTKYLEAKNSETEFQIFMNNDLGEVYSPEGASISKNLLDNSKQSYTLQKVDTEANDRCTMGIDVGKYLHIVISRMRGDKRQVVYVNKLLTEDDNSVQEIISLISRYKVRFGVIDAAPERKLSKTICEASNYVIWRCDYDATEFPTDIYKPDEDEHYIRAARTWIIDEMVEDYKRGRVILPQEAHDVDTGDYYDQMQAPKRVAVKMPNGRTRFVWLEGSLKDHYFHASVYDKLAYILYFGQYNISEPASNFETDENDRVFSYTGGGDRVFIGDDNFSDF